MCFAFVCHTVLPVPCGLEVTCWERDDFLALLCVIISCVFVTFPCGVLGRVWYLIVSIPDIFLPLYFYTHYGNNIVVKYVKSLSSIDTLYHKLQLQNPLVPEKMLNNWYFFKFCKMQIIFLLSDNSAVILFSKVYWFDSLNSFLSFKINKYSSLTGATFPSSTDDFCACG